jgi:hypothetical protein
MFLETRQGTAHRGGRELQFSGRSRQRTSPPDRYEGTNIIEIRDFHDTSEWSRTLGFDE